MRRPEGAHLLIRKSRLMASACLDNDPEGHGVLGELYERHLVESSCFFKSSYGFVLQGNDFHDVTVVFDVTLMVLNDTMLVHICPDEVPFFTQGCDQFVDTITWQLAHSDLHCYCALPYHYQ